MPSLGIPRPNKRQRALFEKPGVPIIKSMSSDDREQPTILINSLADTVETVAPFLVDEMLREPENGASIQ